MATANKVIDLERSYVPMDPNAYPETMHGTGEEDQPENRIPVILYDGYNFLPTSYGYASFFGINSKLEIDAFVGRIDDSFIVQTEVLRNILVVLAEDGIWTKEGNLGGAWTHIVTLAVPDAGQHNIWTKCIIGNTVYMYRQGGASCYRMNAANSFVPTAFVPTFLNMAGQIGIFKAAGRLGFWDSDSSIGWSNADDHGDFKPSLESGAGNAKFQQVLGKIVNVTQHGNGFLIYCTKSIVVVVRANDANYFWHSESVFNNNGVSYYNQAVAGQPDTVHFAYTTFGLVKIEGGKAEYILAEVFTLLKEKKEPIYLRILEGRYLFLEIIDPDLIYPEITFSTGIVPPTTLTWPGASYSIDHPDEGYCKSIAGGNEQEGAYLNSALGIIDPSEATTPNSVPIWEDHLSMAIVVSDFVAYSSIGNTGFFTSIPFTTGGIAKIDGGGNEYFLPTNDVVILRNPPLIADYTPQEHIEDNERNFYSKQDMIWFTEANFMDDWEYAIVHKAHAAVEIAGSLEFRSIATASGSVPVYTVHTFGPYLDMSRMSEHNKHYGMSASKKSASLQRSLTRGIIIEVVSKVLTKTVGGAELIWGKSEAWGLITYPTYAAAMAGGASHVAGYKAFVGDGVGAVAHTGTTEQAGTVGIDDRIILYAFSIDGVPSGSFAVRPMYGGAQLTAGDFTEILPVGLPVFSKIVGEKIQTFMTPRIKYVDYPTCTYRELGFTKIKGHGHYDISGIFQVDDAIAEAADYTDVCDANPPKKKNPEFNGYGLPIVPGFQCGPQDVEIDDEVFTYPDQTLTLPGSTFLLQDGSIEPLYPTFAGAFVYDLQYKKWGKVGQNYKMLIDYSPINSESGDKSIPFEIFGVHAGCFLEDGKVAIFDKFPTDSVMRFGKIGYYRQGFTDCEAVIVQFRNLGTGTLSIEGSIDGKNIEPAIGLSVTFTDTNEVREGFSISARWFNVVLNGIFDLKHLEFKGHRKGKR